MGNTSIIVRNQSYSIGLIPEKFDQHFDRALAVHLLLFQLLEGFVQLLYWNLYAMCHFQLMMDTSWRHRCVAQPLNNCNLIDRELLVG